MFFINNPNLRKLEAFMQEVPNFPPKGVKVDLDKLEDEILLFEVEKVIVSFKQHKGKERIMKFRNDQHRSTFLKEAKKQSLKNHKLIAALYLLTADSKLWETAKSSVGKDDIVFERIHLKSGSETAYALYTLRDLGYSPYVMIYQKETAPPDIKRLQRWCNARWIFRSCADFKDYNG